jgi:hypothetical protein
MKTNRLSTLLLKQKLLNSNWETFIDTFNKVHNSHLDAKLGIVAIRIDDKKKTRNK